MTSFSFSVFVSFSLKFILFCLLVLLPCLHTVSVGENQTDYLALMALKSGIVHDPQNLTSSWNHSIHFCVWEGITCGRKHRRVTVLDLRSKGLVGSLSPYIGNMSFLRQITLQNNTLQGEIPGELGNLFRLQVLKLSNNSFQGKIPPTLSNCSNLLLLELSRNKLTGNIPLQLSTLFKLSALCTRDNYLNEPIPPSIGNLTSLEEFSAAGNLFGGSLPDTLGQLKHLSLFYVGGNKLSGTIPSSFYNMSSLSLFSLAQNQFQGSLLSNIGILLPQLRGIQIWGNNFSGPIPISLSNATELNYVDFGKNGFTGKVDVHFGDLYKLEHLDLYGNNLGTEEGDDLNFFDSLLNCSYLTRLDLSENRLKGVLPKLKSNVTSSSLQILSIGLNRIYGDLPQWMFTPASMTVIAISVNQITGAIPEEIGNLGKIQVLYLDRNQLSGPLPSSMANLSSLTRLQLGLNNFHTTIPSNVNWQNLLFLNLAEGNLVGSIPKQLFSVSTMLFQMNLALNNFEGPLPSEIGNLLHLNNFDASESNLTSAIPNELGRCRSLVSLYLSGNKFQGKLPPSFASLTGLQNLDLSRNNFSGEIPKYLAKFSLEYLNLSYNNFKGEVPVKGVFANASAIFVQGNDRLCGGISELKLPRCITEEPKSRVRRVVIILTIAISSMFCLTISLIFLYCKFKKKTGTGRPASGLLLKTFRKVSYDMILKATDGFSSENLLGVGSFGAVYKGNIEENGASIAVKVLNLQQQGAYKSFMAECKVLQNVRHRNLVSIITSCSSVDFQGNDFKALVYEYMPNGNLQKWLHPSEETLNAPTGQRTQKLLERIDIGIDVGNALDYLHNGCHEPIIHCDLKPNNILLDHDMVAHIGDFGLAKFVPEIMNPTQSSSIGVRGTIGYTAPEYGLGSDPSTSGDVYSYGILLLEMVTGKKPTESIFVDGHNLHLFSKTALFDNVLENVDSVLLEEDDGATEARKVECLIGMIKVGVSCSMEFPRDRMEINNAVNELVSIRNTYVQSIRTRPSNFKQRH